MLGWLQLSCQLICVVLGAKQEGMLGCPWVVLEAKLGNVVDSGNMAKHKRVSLPSQMCLATHCFHLARDALSENPYASSLPDVP